MNTSADVQNFAIDMFKWILLKPVLEGVDGSLNLPARGLNKFNQTESATIFSFFRDSVLLYFILLFSIFAFKII
jgi:hypothetical protein